MPMDQPPTPSLAPPPASPPAVAQPFDLSQLSKGQEGMDFHAVHRRCAPAQAGEIVVCASDLDKNTRDQLTLIGLNPGIACNPNKTTFPGA